MPAARRKSEAWMRRAPTMAGVRRPFRDSSARAIAMIIFFPIKTLSYK
jgi:hypothetical protein